MFVLYYAYDSFMGK